ncbi:hypothetical protein [Paraclostridium tenue]|uniref:C2H2-type domain-containing protein n=1 Tax=Paraclostridium tenue TaxID=1737 RepID=A0ABN1M9D5_9FIRM
MYIKECEYCGKEFKTTQPNAKYCGKYHAGKARAKRQAANKMNKITSICVCCGEVKELIDGYICKKCLNNLEMYVETTTNACD